MFIYLHSDNNKEIEIMKVNVTVKEILTYQITKEVEMTKKEFKEYLKNNTYNPELEYQVAGFIEDEHWICTESRIDNIEEIK